MKRHLPLLALATGAALPLAAAPVSADGFAHVKSLGGLDEYRLDAKGLRVLLLPDHSVPAFTFMVTYHVGSRNEVTGTTGATHILEQVNGALQKHLDPDKVVTVLAGTLPGAAAPASK
jgi:zinc protease